MGTEASLPIRLRSTAEIEESTRRVLASNLEVVLVLNRGHQTTERYRFEVSFSGRKSGFWLKQARASQFCD